MIQIFTSVVNRPDFLEIQAKLFKKFLKNEYVFHVIDDSVEESIGNKFKDICLSNGCEYYKKTSKYRDFDSHSTTIAANACADTIQWTYDNIIRKYFSDYIVLFLDSDMFLVDEFDIEEYMKDEIISGLHQKRGHVEYIWNGIMFFNMPNMKDKEIDFSNGVVEGHLTDVGGNTYLYFKKNGIKFKDTGVEYPTHFNDLDLQKDANGYNMELHLNSKFLHYRAGTNWHTKSKWRRKNDPFVIKEKIFHDIIGDFI
jgi:hypothetical protein